MNFNRSNRATARRAAIAVAAAMYVGFFTQSAWTQGVYTWDPNSSGGTQDGGGTWDTTSPLWWSGSADAVWPNTGNETAVFGVGNGTAGTVNVAAGGVLASALIFNPPGSGTYLIGGGPITLAGASPSITMNASSGTLNSALNVPAAGLTFGGAGFLDLTSTNNSFNNGGTTNITGGTLQLDLSGYSEYSAVRLGAVSVAAGGTLNFTNTGSATDFGLIGFTTFSCNGTIDKTGPGYLDFWSATSIANFAGNINVLQGTLATNTSDWGSRQGA